jgi:hypothetical protein
VGRNSEQSSVPCFGLREVTLMIKVHSSDEESLAKQRKKSDQYSKNPHHTHCCYCNLVVLHQQRILPLRSVLLVRQNNRVLWESDVRRHFKKKTEKIFTLTSSKECQIFMPSKNLSLLCIISAT